MTKKDFRGEVWNNIDPIVLQKIVKINDEAVVCVHCGCSAEQIIQKQHDDAQTKSTMKTIAKILMIVSTAITGLWLIPLAWCLPMTLNYCKKLNNNEPVSMNFKICTLLFVNLIAGILMLCEEN